MSETAERRPIAARAWLAAALSALAAGAASLWLGQDYNFDLLNYHYYCGYAFLHGRLAHDIVPGGIQTYHAPLLHVFHYLGIAHLPPRLFGFLLGALHGLGVPLVFLLTLRLLPPALPHRVPVALAAGVAAGIGPNAVSMLGTTFGDNLLTLPWLAALCLVLAPAPETGTDRWRLRSFGAGVLAGAAAGLKLTMAVYHPLLVLAIAVGGRPRARRLGAVVWFLVGSLIGFAPTGGLWALWLYREFGNPVFPFANGVFRSEYFAPRSFGREVYATRSLADVIRPVVDAALGRHERLLEVPLRDLRYLLVLGAGVAWVATAAWRRTRRPARDEVLGARRLAPLTHAETAVLACWGVGYLLWIALFPYYRYLTPLEISAPLVLLALARRLVPDRRLLHTMVAVTLLLALTTRVGSWGRRGWEPTWLEIEVPPLGLQRGSLVLLVGQPISFVAPSFPADATFVHLTAIDGFGADAKWRERIAAALRSHGGPVLLLSNFQFPRAMAEARAAEFGFTPVVCEPVRRGPLRFRLCEMKRRP